MVEANQAATASKDNEVFPAISQSQWDVSREVHENLHGLICLGWQKPLAGTSPSRLTEHGEETELAERDLAEQQEKVPKVFEQVLQAETKELNMPTFEEERIARIKEIVIDCGVGPTGAVDDDEYSDLVDYICELDAKCDKLIGKCTNSKKPFGKKHLTSRKMWYA